jgi:hypothetical protein
MTKRPDDEMPEAPGGRAAERLREFIDARFPEGERPELPVDDTPAEDALMEGAAEDGADDEEAEPADGEPERGPGAALGEDPGTTEEEEDGDEPSHGSVNPDP